MTKAADERPDRRTEDRSGSPAVGAIAIWLLVQLIVLALGAARVPLWYRAPDPVERGAIEQVLAAQIIAAALLFPWLMRGAVTSACVVLVSAPFVQLAAMLSETEMHRATRAWLYAALWLGALAAWAAALRSPRARLGGVAVAGAVAIGLPVLRYLRLEFSDESLRPLGALARLDPVAGALSQLHARTDDIGWWAFPPALLAAGLLAALRARARARATSYPQD